MMKKILHFNKEAISAMPSRYRANFINSITGFKSANLIGTISPKGIENLAVISSITHIGSNPPLLSYITRPTTVARHTYSNIKETGVFTVNHIHSNIINQSHQTAAAYDSNISEYNAVGLTAAYRDDFKAPFVKEAHIQLACEYVNEYEIKENGTILVIGAITNITIPEDTLYEDGWVHLQKADGVAINGLDSYTSPQIIDRFTYAKPDKKATSILDK